MPCGWLGVRRIAQGLHPVGGFPAVWGVDLDARQLKRALALSLMTALEGMHAEPKTKEIEPVLSRLPTLETAFDPQIGLQDAVNRLSRTTGADHALQDVQQFFGQSVKRLIICGQFGNEN